MGNRGKKRKKEVIIGGGEASSVTGRDLRYEEKIRLAADYLHKRIAVPVKIGIILGSGLGKIAEEAQKKAVIPYRDIPGFPESTIPGHKGELIYGRTGRKEVLIFNGRYHYYQGYSLHDVTLPVRVAKRLGIETFIITNSSGGINRKFRAGDIMLVTDHINLMGDNPLRGIESGAFGSPFVDLTEPYDLKLLGKAKEVARNNPEIGELREGVYVAVSGPSYETEAEISFYRRAGADAVGMSTVPEVIVSSHEGIRVLCISAITNLATGLRQTALTHEEVLTSTENMSSRIILLIKEIIKYAL